MPQGVEHFDDLWRSTRIDNAQTFRCRALSTVETFGVVQNSRFWVTKAAEI